MRTSDKPLVTALVITYNQCNFVEEALASVLAQTYSPLQIIVSDDCSTDGTFEKIKSFLAERGRGDVEAMQTPRNGGLGANLNFGIAHAKGEIVVMFAGDDFSNPERCEDLVREFGVPADRVFAVTSDANRCDRTGRITGYELGWRYGESPEAGRFWASGVSTCGAAMAYRREVFDVFGPLQPGMNWEDQVYPLRAALLGTVRWIKRPLVFYRHHDTNMTLPIDLKRIAAQEFRERVVGSLPGDIRIATQKLLDLDVAEARFGKTAETSLLRRRLEAHLRTLAALKRWAAGRLGGAFPLLECFMRRDASFANLVKSALMISAPSLWLAYVRRGMQKA